MQKRCLEGTGIEVSVVGLGTVKFGRNQSVKYPNSFALPTDKEVKKILEKAQELGINLLDTAPAYGTSEERVGKAITGRRHDWVIITKTGEEFVNNTSVFDFSPVALTKSIDRSLQRLRTDYLDIVLVHSNGEDERIINEMEVFVTLAQCKRAGKIRAYGLSSKTIAGGLLTLQHADCAMVAMNPHYLDEVPVIRFAEKQGKGIFIKKAFASGHLNWASEFSPVKSAFQCIFAEQGVTSVVMGTINPDHLEENVSYLKADRLVRI